MRRLMLALGLLAFGVLAAPVDFSAAQAQNGGYYSQQNQQNRDYNRMREQTNRTFK